MRMLSPRDIPIRTGAVKPKSLSRQPNRNKYGGQSLRPSHLSGINGHGKKGISSSYENPCLRRMRELHTVEIRNKRTKELVDLEVGLSVVKHYMW